MPMEAREFLKDNKNRTPLCSNKLGSAKSARKFIEALYAAGAKLVEVDDILNELWRIEQEGGAYACSIWLTIPTGNTQVLRVAADKKPEEFSIEANGKVRIWWD